MAGLDTFAFALQFATIIGGGLGIIFAALLISEHVDFGGVIFYLFAIFFCVLIIMSEIHAFPIFRYTAFILTIWGKGLMFLFLGCFEFRTGGVGLVAAILLWVMFILYIVLFFVLGKSSLPLTQKKTPPEFETKEADYYSEAPPPDEVNPSTTEPLDDGTADEPMKVSGPEADAVAAVALPDN
jgi:hypothetical protein